MQLWKEKCISLLTAGMMAVGVATAMPMEKTVSAADTYPVQAVNFGAYTTNRNLNLEGNTVNTQVEAGELSENWEIVWVSDGVYQIVNFSDDSYLSASGGSCVTAAASGGAEQQWNITGVDQDSEGEYLYYKITNVSTGDALTYYQGSNVVGLTDYIGDGAQKWKLNLYGLQGYAANAMVDGAEKACTIGGLLGETVFVDTDDELKNAMLSTEPLTIVLTTDLDWHPYGQQEIRSYKTLVGAYGVTLKDAQIRTCPNDTDSSTAPSDNLVFRNLTLLAKDSTNCMLFNIYSSRNIWIDHCSFVSELPRSVDEVGKFIWCNSPFGGTWVSRATDFITISYCSFYNRYWTALFASVSYEVPETEKIRCRISFLYCKWEECVRRCPQMGSAFGHVLCNFYRGKSSTETDGIDQLIGGGQTDVVSANCRFEAIASGHEICAGGGTEPYRDDGSYTATDANVTPTALNFSPAVTSTRVIEEENYGYSLLNAVGDNNTKDFCVQYTKAAASASEHKYITDSDMQFWASTIYPDPFLTAEFESAFGSAGAVIDTAYRYALVNVGSGLYLEIAADGSNVQQGTTGENVWQFVDAGDGYYQLVTESGMALTVAGGSADNGANICVEPVADTDAQMFKLINNGDSYTITSKVTMDGSAVGITGGSLEEGANAMQWVRDGTDNQKWTLEMRLDPINGNLIQNLTPAEITYYTSWAIDTDIQVGDLVFGDRDVTYTSLPAAVIGAEAILTPCDAKNQTSDLATFEAGADITVYVALDARVAALPSWLSDWELTTLTATNSKEVTFTFYSKTLSAGERLTLGENGQSSGCVNYTVFAVEQTAETTTAGALQATLYGDVNVDGLVSIDDVILLNRMVAEDTAITITAVGVLNADCVYNGVPDADDATAILRLLAGTLQASDLGPQA